MLLMIWYVLICIYKALMGFILHPMNLSALYFFQHFTEIFSWQGFVRKSWASMLLLWALNWCSHCSQGMLVCNDSFFHFFEWIIELKLLVNVHAQVYALIHYCMAGSNSNLWNLGSSNNFSNNFHFVAWVNLQAVMDPKVEARVSGVVFTSPAVGIQPSHPFVVVRISIIPDF